MKKRLLLLLGFASLVCTEVLDLGDLGQYQADVGDLGEAFADSILVKNSANGLDLLLGQDIQDQIMGVLEGCGESDNDCYQEVHKVLQDAHLQTGRRLGNRDWVNVFSAIGKSFGSPWRLLTGVSSLIVTGTKFLDDRNQLSNGGIVNFVHSPIHFPEEQASQVGALPATTAITVSAQSSESSAAATVSAIPDPASSIQGEATPSVVAEEDELVYSFADELNEDLQTSAETKTACDVGLEFDKQHGNQKRADGGTYGQAICVAEAIIRGTVPGAPFNDLLYLSANDLSFTISENAGIAFEAAKVVEDFATEYSELMGKEKEDAQRISRLVLVLAIKGVVNGDNLTQNNRISADLIAPGDSENGGDEEPNDSNRPDGCPEKGKVCCAALLQSITPVFEDFETLTARLKLVCGMPEGDVAKEDCSALLIGSGDTKGFVCKSGNHEGCPCLAGAFSFVNNVTEDFAVAILDFAKHVAERLSNGGDDDSDDDGGDDDSSSGLPKFTCSRTLTEFPAHLFSSDDYSVHEAFCNHWKDSQISGWRVNAKGEHGSANDQAKRQEAVPEDFMGWNFQLKYSPIFEHEGGTPCSLDCNGMYRKLTEECSLDEGGVARDAGGGYFLLDDNLAQDTCGNYSMTVFKPAVEEVADDDVDDSDDESEDDVVLCGRNSPESPTCDTPEGYTYYTESYEGITTDPSHWECEYQQEAPFDSPIPWCACKNIAGDCENCEPLLEGPYLEWGCLNRDSCDGCRPWELTCVSNYCDKGTVGECEECRPVE